MPRGEGNLVGEGELCGREGVSIGEAFATGTSDRGDSARCEFYPFDLVIPKIAEVQLRLGEIQAEAIGAAEPRCSAYPVQITERSAGADEVYQVVRAQLPERDRRPAVCQVGNLVNDSHASRRASGRYYGHGFACREVHLTHTRKGSTPVRPIRIRDVEHVSRSQRQVVRLQELCGCAGAVGRVQRSPHATTRD